MHPITISPSSAENKELLPMFANPLKKIFLGLINSQCLFMLIFCFSFHLYLNQIDLILVPILPGIEDNIDSAQIIISKNNDLFNLYNFYFF